MNGELLVDENSATAVILVYEGLRNLQDTKSQVQLVSNQAFAVNGVINFTGFKIKARPGSVVKLLMRVDLKSEVNGVPQISETIIEVNIRECVVGESLTEDEYCEVCAVGTYLMETTSAPRPCKTCGPEMVCFGRNNIAPKMGYWRQDTQSDVFFGCLHAEACLQGDMDNQMSLCA